MELMLREHQEQVIEALREGFRKGHQTQLLYAPTGFGKTEVAIALMKATREKYNCAAMVLDRLVLVDQTSLRLSKYQLPHGVFQSGHWKFDMRERLQVCSAQTLERRDSFPQIDLLIVDECFVAGTKVQTTTGSVDIENVRVGDVVLNQCGVGVVEAVSVKPATETYLLEFDDGTTTECTGNHPFLTPSGWKAARELEVGESFFGVEGVRLLWESVQSLDQEGRKREGRFCLRGEELEQAINLLTIMLKEAEESHEQSSGSAQAKSQIERDHAQAYCARRQRALAAFAAIGIAPRTWGGVGGGVRCGDQDEASWDRLSHLLQAGYRKSKTDDCDRGGRRESLQFGGASKRQAEGRVFGFTRLVGISRIQREGAVAVFNLQVSGHPSYFADGRLVHNCHIARKQTIEFIKANPKVRVVGLTATPFTKGLGDVYKQVVCGATNEWLVNNKWLTPLKVFIAKEIDMTGAKKVAGEWAQDVVTERGMKITGDIVEEWIKKTHEIYGKPEKTIVFCAGVAHGADLVEQFARKGYNFVSISYKDNDEFKREAIEDFARPDTQINGLIATDILTRGFDVPDVKIGVSARPFSKSLSSHVQQMGRIMRPYEGKDFAVWLDHSGNYLRFRDDWDELYEDGVKELDKKIERAKKEPTELEKKESKCPACGYLWPRNADSCPSCGHVRQRRSQIEAVAGELQELFTGDRAKKDDKQSFYSELLYYATQRGYNPHWASHKYREKFGVWPRGLSDTPLPTTQKTANWIKSRNIAWAKSQNRVRMST